MRKIFIVITGLLFSATILAGNGLWVEGRESASERVNTNLKSLGPDAYVKVSEKVSEAVVNISTTKIVKSGGPFRFKTFPGPRNDDDQKRPPSPFDNFFGDDFFERFFGGPKAMPREDLRQQSLGSGFILNSQGYILTNNHVVERADEIKIVLHDESEFPAKLIGRDPKTDIALLKIESKKELKSVILGDSSQMKVGEVVIAIGNPFGLSHSVTQGIVSAKERSIGFGAYDDFIQTDASINPGNSGGPLLNLSGEVIGINAAIVAAGQGIGFAIPINLAKDILLKLKKDGRVIRGWLGVLIQKVTAEHAKAFKLPKQDGALVAEVVKGSPAEKTGLKAGDVIIKFRDREIKNWHELPLAVANTPVGEKVKLEAVRDGQRKEFTVEIAKLEDTESELAQTESLGADKLGLRVQDLTKELAKSLDLEEDVKGVLVADIDEASVAYARGIRRSDIIVEVNRRKVLDRNSYLSIVNEIKKGDTILLLVKRGKGTIYIAFTL